MKWQVLLIALLAIPVVAAPESIQVETFEDGKITNYLNTYWVVNVNGTGTLSNPSDRDLFDVRLYYDILTLSLVPGPGDGLWETGSVLFETVPAQTTQTFSYQIVGITAEPPTLQNRGVLYTGLTKKQPRIYSDVFGELQKAPVEEVAITNRNARLISLTLRNPTNLELTIESVRVIKTPELDPNNQLDNWYVVNASSPVMLDENGFFVHDFIDENAMPGEIYWLQNEVYISDVLLVDNNTIKRFTEKNLSRPEELLNITNETENVTYSLISPNYVLKKEASKALVAPNEPVTIKLTLYNLGPQIANYNLVDYLPAGFISNSELQWSGRVSGRNSISHTYKAVLNESVLAGIDIFPSARATVGSKTLTSNTVAFIRQFSPDDQVYLQKRIAYRDDDSVEVTIQIQNLGLTNIEGAVLRDYLEDDVLFSEISQSPRSKGVWDIAIIEPGTTWEVTYVTEQSESLNTLPLLSGVNNKNLLRSLVLQNVIKEGWAFVGTKAVEITGIALLVIVPLVLFFRKRSA